MRGAWGKSYGTAARCDIGQVLMSVRTQEAKTQIAVEACRRAKFKFPGRQKIHISSKYGLTKFSKDDYKKWKDYYRCMMDLYWCVMGLVGFTILQVFILICMGLCWFMVI